MEREERDVRVARVSAQKGRFQEDAVQLYITFQKASELKNNSHLFILPPVPPVSSAHCFVHLGCHFSRPHSIWRFGREPGGEDSSFPRNAFISIPRLYLQGRGAWQDPLLPVTGICIHRQICVCMCVCEWARGFVNGHAYGSMCVCVNLRVCEGVRMWKCVCVCMCLCEWI